MNRFILVLHILLFLQGCNVYHRNGYVSPKSGATERNLGGGYYETKVKIDTSDKIYKYSSDKVIFLRMPQRIKDENCKTIVAFVLPFYFDSDCGGNSWTSKGNNLVVSINVKPLTESFINNLEMSLLSNRREFRASKTIGTDYITFSFPVTISDVEIYESSLMLTYKGYKKQIPIKYETKWYSRSR